ncbi:MAG: hypothetical protein FWE83_01205 [Oscillospiraceae bacterium]|nr:hypothetical protein [Oscillospiraceae bacterium]
MRKHQQKQILELLGTLKSLQETELYADCQDGAIAIGEFIEELEGKGTQTVALLDDYCELLYKASIGEVGKKALDKGFLRIENSVKNEFKQTRYEMVFLSYKASMSDSIESIYTAAKADPSCDVYWIPIPYYECNQDGTLGAMHYEGAEYYKDSIECTDWRIYNIEERHPDVIVTFAPYDELGHMTSVHPDFYCRRLRELTEMLVYVPYFVTSENIGAPFTKCPGVMFSHLVIVQSEAVRQCYIRDYKELEKIGYSRDIYGAPEDKIIALGSPKFDAVINAKREDFSLPKSWAKLNKNKKVILLNTSVTPIVNYKEQYLKKLQYVLDAFRDRNDVVLWWRPHPLSESAYDTMNPELAGQYNRIVEVYKQTDYGIYDDTPELHRAISWTDAYYGDPSSLVILYQATGKPIMINDPKITETIPPFEPTDICITKNNFWFTIRRFNALISMDRNTWIPEFAGSFPDESDYIKEPDDSLYRKPVEVDGILYFPPFLANEIVMYSTQTGTFGKIKYKEAKDYRKETGDFLAAVVSGDFIFFIPYEYPAIIQLNIKTMEITCHTDWIESLTKLMGDVKGFYLGYPFTINCSVWLPVLEANIIMEFDMETYEYAFHEVGEKDYRYCGSYFDGIHFWLSPHWETKAPVVKWNPDTGETTYFADIYVDGKDHAFYPMFFYGGYIWLLPMFGEHAVIINTATDSVSIASEFASGPADSKNGHALFKFISAQNYGDSIYAFIYYTGTLIKYDFITESRKEEIVNYNPEISVQLENMLSGRFIKDIKKIKTVQDYCYYESDYYRLNGFLVYIEKDNDEEKSQRDRRKEVARSLSSNPDGTAGKKIYEYIKKTILS